MSDTNATHCDFAAIMSIDKAPAVTQAVSLLQFTMFSDGPEYTFLGDLVIPEEMSYTVTYYNEFGLPYVPQQVVIVDGQLSAQENAAGFPTLQVRADIMAPFPGSVESDTYLDTLPPAYNPRLSVVGMVVGHHTDSAGQRMFILKVMSYAGRENGTSIYNTFHIACAIPGTPRWARTRLPTVGRFIQVSCRFIGFYPWEDRHIICGSLLNISYLPSSRDTAPAATAPSTPNGRRRLRVMGGSGLQNSPSRRVQLNLSTPVSSQASDSADIPIIDTLAPSSAPTSSGTAASTSISSTPVSSTGPSSIAIGKRPAENPLSDGKHKRKKNKKNTNVFTPKSDRASSPDWPSQLQDNDDL
ncbi:uncharacterized protein BDW43DRAFT_317452 [Aspergillus alliaceus]|uniref:uncharacterized protein n=1 Tax=Petromyces alliaceus TaxID=209559 RepID=UPI0012A5BD1D|nr:uncharacterized protein BDW43DRAFT_317452 [Aspergillus alliaceus]KAB8226809.1 hypothetical protein BDW43DRAFT_317452 [Aspergillus alliaceus]